MPVFVTAFLFMAALMSPALAQEAPAPPPAAAEASAATDAPAGGGPLITLELNKIEPGEGGCNLYFVLGNQSPDDLAELQTEEYLFDKDGAILRGALLQFQGVRSGRTKVVAFSLPELGCDAIGRVLVNEVPVCTKPDGSAVASCAERLQVTSRADVELAY